VERFDAFVRRSSGLDAPDLAERRQDAMERLAAIRATHGAVRVTPPKSGAIMLVRAGGGDPKPAGFIAYFAPGEHELEIYAGTSHARSIRVHAVAGTTIDVAIPDLAAPAEPAPPSPPPSPSPAERRSFPTGWLVAGTAITLASGVLPLALGIRTGDKRDAAEAIGPASSQYASAVSEFEDARTLYQLSYVVPIMLAVATTVIVLVSLPPKSGSTASSTRRGIPWSAGIAF
jgi:hypothetical protein